MSAQSPQSASEAPVTRHEAASRWFMKLRTGEIEADDAAYRAWLQADPAHAEALIAVQSSWAALGEHASAPEMVAARRDALARSTRAAASRWRIGTSVTVPRLAWASAVAAGLVILLGVPALLMGPLAPDETALERIAEPQLFETQIAETRVVTLADNSRISLDAATRLTADYTAAARRIELLQGQAHFDVAHDPLRPFTVRAGDQSVVATGTAFNVEIVDGEVVVTLLEGEVVVTDVQPALPERPSGSDGLDPSATPEPTPPEPQVLRPGQQLVASAASPARIRDDANLHKTTAWRRGDVMFEDDPLSIAVARMNRYSRIELQVMDDALDALRVSGVFDAGDTDAFVEAVEAYFPVDARRMSADRIELHARP